MISLTIKIPKYKLPLLQKEVDKYNTRLRRYKLPELNIISDIEELKQLNTGKAIIHIPVLTIEIENVIPDIPEIPLGIASKTSKYSLAKEYFSIIEQEDSGVCDLCETIRDRETTYLLYNKSTKKIKHFGKRCLREYMENDNADKILELYIQIAENIDLYSNLSLIQKENIFTVNNIAVLPFDYFIIKGCYLVRTEGYKSPKKNSNPTGKKIMDSSVEFHANDADVELASKVTNWIDKINPINDYERRLKAIKKAGYVDMPTANFLASAIWTYQEALRGKYKGASEYQGIIGDKLNLSCTLTQVIKYPVTYNNKPYICHKYIFRDDQSNLYNWSTHTVIDAEVGESLQVNGIIKAHIEYKGIKITSLKKCIVGTRQVAC